MPGFAGSGNKCVDKDECKSGQDKCSAYATCTNSDGTYTCKCKPGFDGDGLYCTDINECAKGIKTCGANEDCVNSKGGVQCQCSPGFKKQGNSCINPNTCNPACGNNQMCIKDKLGFSCQCKPGYTKDLQGGCGDLDECSVNNGGCSYLAQCANQKGSSPVCTCKTGYFGDGKTCVPDKVTVTLHSVLIHPAKGGKQHWDGFGKIDPKVTKAISKALALTTQNPYILVAGEIAAAAANPILGATSPPDPYGTATLHTQGKDLPLKLKGKSNIYQPYWNVKWSGVKLEGGDKITIVLKDADTLGDDDIGTIIITHAHLLKVLAVGTVYPIQVSGQGNPVLFVQLSVQSEINPPEGSCADQCSDLKPGSFKTGATCQCDASCLKYGDCCSDFTKYCSPPK
jgi:hypothetical protein